jgi:hypothetical protein
MDNLPKIANENKVTLSGLVKQQELSNTYLKDIRGALLQTAALDKKRLDNERAQLVKQRTEAAEARDEKATQTDKDGKSVKEKLGDGAKKGMGFFKAIAPLLGLGALAFFVDNPDAIKSTVKVIGSVVDWFTSLSDNMQLLLGGAVGATLLAPKAVGALIGGIGASIGLLFKGIGFLGSKLSGLKGGLSKMMGLKPSTGGADTTKSGRKVGEVFEDKKGGKKQVVKDPKTGSLSSKAVPKSTAVGMPAANQNAAPPKPTAQTSSKKPFDLAKKFPRAAKVMGIAKKIPLIGPVFTGLAVMSLLSSNKSPKEISSGLAGIIGGLGGSILGGFLGSIAGSIIPGPGTIIGAIGGSILGGLGGETIATGLAQWMTGQKVDAFPDKWWLPDINSLMNGKEDKSETASGSAPTATPPKPTPKPAAKPAAKTEAPPPVAKKETPPPAPKKETPPPAATAVPKVDSAMSEAVPVEEIPELPVATAESKPKPSAPAVQKKAAKQVKENPFKKPDNYIDYSQIKDPTEEDIKNSKRQLSMVHRMNRHLRNSEHQGYRVTHANGTFGYVPASDIKGDDTITSGLKSSKMTTVTGADGSTTQKRQGYMMSQAEVREKLGISPPAANDDGMKLEGASRAAGKAGGGQPVIVNTVNQTDASTNVSNKNQNSAPINPVNQDRSLKLASGA